MLCGCQVRCMIAKVLSYFVTSGCHWKIAFDFVKHNRPVCAPNTSFTCNLIEFDELLHQNASLPLLFRCSSHLPHDQHTLVLKLQRSADSRKICTPLTSLLCQTGLFVIRPRLNADGTFPTKLYVWCGLEVSGEFVAQGVALAKELIGILSFATEIEIVEQGMEPPDFYMHVNQDSSIQSDCFSSIDQFSDRLPCSIPLPRIVESRRSTVDLGSSSRSLMGELSSPTSRRQSLSLNRQISMRISEQGGVVMDNPLSITLSRGGTENMGPQVRKNSYITELSLLSSYVPGSIPHSASLSTFALAAPPSETKGEKSPRPRLYHCIPNQEGKYEWSRLGVYDDEDLDEV
jgi:hypothetical protein